MPNLFILLLYNIRREVVVLKAVKVNERISLDFKFCCYGQSKENN